MPGKPDQLYIEARRALLDALDALKPHLDSLIVVGAQAIYLHAREADVAVAPYTKDGDVAVDPRNLGSDPALDAAMLAAGFTAGVQPGIWHRTGTLLRSTSLCPIGLAGRVDIAALAWLGMGHVRCDAWPAWKRRSSTTPRRASAPLSHPITERSRCVSPAQERSS